MLHSPTLRWPLVMLPLAAFPILAVAFQAQQTPPTQPPAAAQPAPGARGGRAMTPEQREAMEAQQKATQADHQQMMDQLGIKELRRGRDGNNKDSPFYANYDESKANPYPDAPGPAGVEERQEGHDRRRCGGISAVPKSSKISIAKSTAACPRTLRRVKWEVIRHHRTK